MANLKNVIYLSNEDYETLVSTGTVTIDGETLTYDENNVYVTPDKLASTTEDGLMSSSDKVKLDSLPTFGTAASKDFTTSVTSGSSDLVTSGAVYTAIDNLPKPMIYKGTLGTGGTITDLPAAASSNEGFTYKVITDGTYASQSAKVGDIFISNGSEWTLVPSGDDAGEDTVRQINVNGTQLLGTSISTGYVNFKNGSNVTISGSGHDITISATDTTYSDATTSASGLMSASDKTKLNGIASGAEVNVQSDWSVTDSTSDAFIKNKPTIPDTSNLVPYSGATSNVDLGNNVLLGVGVATKYGGVTSYISGEHISGGVGGTYFVVSNGDISRLIDPSDTPTNTTLYNFPIISGGTSENPTVKTVATTDAIPTTYIKSASSSGNTLTLTKQDNTTTTFTPTFSDTNQKVKAGSVTFGNNDVVDIVAGDNVTVTGLASGTGAPKITISATDTDTGATSIETTGSGNAVTTASYDSTTRKITLTKGSTFLTSESHVGDVVSVGATSGSHIVIGGTTANPTVGVESGYSIPSTTDQSTWSGKQDALSTQTAYTSKGSTTKVPQITTNSLGQVTNITEVIIAHQSIKNLNTSNTTAQTVSSSEAINGSGTINLHKIAKTGTYSDLIGKPDLGAPYVVQYTDNVLNFITTNNVSGKTILLRMNGTDYISIFKAQGQTNYYFYIKDTSNEYLHSGSLDMTGLTFANIFNATYTSQLAKTSDIVNVGILDLRS